MELPTRTFVLPCKRGWVGQSKKKSTFSEWEKVTDHSNCFLIILTHPHAQLQISYLLEHGQKKLQRKAQNSNYQNHDQISMKIRIKDIQAKPFLVQQRQLLWCPKVFGSLGCLPVHCSVLRPVWNRNVAIFKWLTFSAFENEILLWGLEDKKPYNGQKKTFREKWGLNEDPF